MPYRKTCRSCHKEFVCEDRQAIEAIEVCDVCLVGLPDAIEYIADGVDMGDSSVTLEEAPDTPSWNSGAPDFGFPATPSPSNDDPAPDANRQESPASSSNEDEPREYELRWTGTNRSCALPVVLPDAVSGGYVGRDNLMCDAVVDRPTISRIQFAYRNLCDGNGIEITNYSQFGTWVNGQLLQRNESASAPSGSTIEMGGFMFDLVEKVG